MKKLFLASLALLISITIYADTNVYLRNNTTSTIKLSTQTGYYSFNFSNSKAGLIWKNAAGSPYKIIARTVAPGQRAKILELNRNTGVKNGKTYFFKTKVTGTGLPSGNDTIYLLQRLKGKFVGSDAAFGYELQKYLNQPKFVEKGGRTIKLNAGVGSKDFSITGKWDYEAGDIYEDIEYTISESGKVTPANELKLWQTNIQQRPWVGDTDRGIVTKLAPSIKAFDPDIDVITVNEAFAKSIRPDLKESMKQNGFIYQTDVLNKNGGALWSGGVMVFSKYPIKKTKEMIFKNFAADDKNADKGVLYVQIDKRGKLYNIFATHTNASYTFGGKSRLPMNDKGRAARAKQFTEIKQFINAQRIPSNQPVIIVGDMNVDMISEKGRAGDEYTNMLKALNAGHPTIVGHKYTLDKNSNSLVDKDDGPPQYLDYALYSKAHQKPLSAGNEPICLKQGGKNVCSKTGKDLSDHYPIRAKFTFSN